MSFIRQYWLLLLLALPFFVALDDSSLWDSNEAFYAQTPREMLEQSNWFAPSFNGKPRLNKPPLSYWVVAPFYSLFSPSVFWERFPMALLAYGSVLAVFLTAKFSMTGRWRCGRQGSLPQPFAFSSCHADF